LCDLPAWRSSQFQPSVTSALFAFRNFGRKSLFTKVALATRRAKLFIHHFHNHARDVKR